MKHWVCNGEKSNWVNFMPLGQFALAGLWLRDLVVPQIGNVWSWFGIREETLGSYVCLVSLSFSSLCCWEWSNGCWRVVISLVLGSLLWWPSSWLWAHPTELSKVWQWLLKHCHILSLSSYIKFLFHTIIISFDNEFTRWCCGKWDNGCLWMVMTSFLNGGLQSVLMGLLGWIAYLPTLSGYLVENKASLWACGPII